MRSFRHEVEKLARAREAAGPDPMLELLRRHPVIIYGAGAAGVSLCDTLAAFGIIPAAFCDRSGGDRTARALPVISPAQLAARRGDYLVIVGSQTHGASIRRDLTALNIPGRNILPDCFLNLREALADDFSPHIDGYCRAYRLFQDGLSREVMLGRAECHYLGTPLTQNCLLADCALPLQSQYFDAEVVRLRDGEVFADCGMAAGDTAEGFARACGGRYGHIYGFEPNTADFERAVRALPRLHSFTPENLAVSQRCGRVSFASGMGGSSRIADFGPDDTECCSLDAYFASLPYTPTFIKMDIEGAEGMALAGAEGIIRESKPKLAVCAYHRPQDLYELPEQILGIRGDYRLYLRHYGRTTTETVLYAV